MGKIHLLDLETSNKIAAGEVVERPASVIKELVENSIDAGATKITVEIRNGGNSLMRVSDNGCGMSPEDAQIAFLRHATSKIKESSELDAIFTLGFRGEALASVGAVSKTDIFTREKGSSIGTHVSCDGGEIIAYEEDGISEGTVIEVKDLFFNTPARRKFLKKDSAEANWISDIMERFILAYPEISFRLVNNGKDQVFSSGDGKQINCVYSVYGKDFAAAMLPVDYTNGSVRVSGLIGKGTLARANRSFQSFYVNKRYIKSGLAIRATEEAYKNQIMIGKFPMAILNIEVDPSSIDINVHPTKLEVKFSEEKAVYDAVYYGVKSALYAIPNVPEISKKTEEREENKNFTKENVGKQLELKKEEKKEEKEEKEVKEVKSETEAEVKQEVKEVKEETKKNDESTVLSFENSKPLNLTPDIKKAENTDPLARFKKTEDPKIMTFAEPKTEFKREIVTENVNVKNDEPKVTEQTNVGKITEETAKKEEKILFEGESEKIKNEVRSVASVLAEEAEDGEECEIPAFKIVGQVFSTYIIAETGDEMLLIDQHAAHERLKYEELKKNLKEKRMYPQILLEPIIIHLGSTEKEHYEKNAALLSEFGFESEEFGDRDIIIRATPADVDLSYAEDMFTELLNQVANDRKELISEKYQRMIYTIACKSAIKANHNLTVAEMERLVTDVFALKNINTCPHGRPIIIKMTKKEIEKYFKRIV